MSSASDYSVGSPPQGASYSAPLVGFQFGKQLANLIPDYFKSTQQARTLEMQKPILGPDGQPTTDIKTIVSELNRRGGGEFAASMLPFLQKQGVLDVNRLPNLTPHRLAILALTQVWCSADYSAPINLA